MIAPLLVALSVLTAAFEPPEGVWTSASIDAGVVAGDVVVGPSLGLGLQLRDVAVHLRAPALLRVIDNAPTVDPALPSACAWLRCEELLVGGRLRAEALSRVVDELSIGLFDDAFTLRAGRLAMTLGDGVVVDRHTGAAEWDRRRTGAHVAVRAPWWGLRSEAYVGHVLAPQELFALRQAIAPVPMLPVVVAATAGADLVAPDGADAIDAQGDVKPGARTRPLVVGAVELRVPLPRLWALQLTPLVDGSVSHGLSRDGGARAAFGAGAGVGAELELDLDVVGARAGGVWRVVGDGHRAGVFGTLYDVERRRALLGGIDGGGLVRVPAPAGDGGEARIEASVLGAWRGWSRLHVEPAPGGNFVESGMSLDVGVVRVGGLALRRGLQDARDLVSGDLVRLPIVAVVEASARIVGPWSISLRWMRLPRFRDGTLEVDDDVLVGLSGDVVLAPR